jgi:hypothetical protein
MALGSRRKKPDPVKTVRPPAAAVPAPRQPNQERPALAPSEQARSVVGLLDAASNNWRKAFLLTAIVCCILLVVFGGIVAIELASKGTHLPKLVLPTGYTIGGSVVTLSLITAPRIIRAWRTNPPSGAIPTIEPSQSQNHEPDQKPLKQPRLQFPIAQSGPCLPR